MLFRSALRDKGFSKQMNPLGLKALEAQARLLADPDSRYKEIIRLSKSSGITQVEAQVRIAEKRLRLEYEIAQRLGKGLEYLEAQGLSKEDALRLSKEELKTTTAHSEELKKGTKSLKEQNTVYATSGLTQSKKEALDLYNQSLVSGSEEWSAVQKAEARINRQKIKLELGEKKAEKYWDIQIAQIEKAMAAATENGQIAAAMAEQQRRALEALWALGAQMLVDVAQGKDRANRGQNMGGGAGQIGGTLAGNGLSIVAMKATLQHVLTEEFYAKAIVLQEQFTAGVESVIKEFVKTESGVDTDLSGKFLTDIPDHKYSFGANYKHKWISASISANLNLSTF